MQLINKTSRDVCSGGGVNLTVDNISFQLPETTSSVTVEVTGEGNALVQVSHESPSSEVFTCKSTGHFHIPVVGVTGL